MKKITPAQLRSARALVRWSAAELAEASKVGVATIRKAEVRQGETGMHWRNEEAVITALEAAGVLFIAEDDEAGPGVRLRKSDPQVA